jgi:hypothetical protein
MRNWFRDSLIGGVGVLGVLSLAAPPSAAQAPAYRAPRTANGGPGFDQEFRVPYLSRYVTGGVFDFHSFTRD